MKNKGLKSARHEIINIALEIEQALGLGRFIHYRASWDFISNLEGVKHQIDALVTKGEAKRPATLDN